jgi:hypothetical protein
VKKWIVAGLALTAVIATAAFLLKANTGLYGKSRITWKDKAIAEIAGETADADWLAKELASVKASVAKEPEGDAWISEHLALMKNGDWIFYANICQKQDVTIPDLFIARGSDGKWYYSTFHFCIGMLNAKVVPQPESLTQFVDWYYLEEFDGHSDECLKRTWPLKEGAVDPKASKRGRWK